MVKKLPYAEDLNFWKSGKSTPDTWLDKAESEIEKHGGTVFLRAQGKDPQTGNEAYLLQFEFAPDQFKAVWPVLPTRNEKDNPAARRQAATMLYHDVKNKCLKSSIFGARVAFFEYLQLPDGQNITQMSTPELAEFVPRALLR